ncbi:hypothetical protein [Egicoccus sp. AB-alg6-2]|uniref:hypothetical protein n=1 Tax=Egicoccus sp. AB-alg6-2 TaxID=3242692 RepID=UPI00359DD16E
MFVQFIEGPIDDPKALRDRLDRWRDDLAAGSGWAGTTAGVTDEGTAFVAARFESAEAARANSDRAEQSEWWAETERLFGGQVSFEDHEDVSTFRSGGSDDAGFVQVIRGKVNDVDTARELMVEMPDDIRPDVIGGLVGLAPDGTYTTVVYFTSEAAAREGETDEGDEFSEQMNALHDQPPRFLDLPDPWMWSP